MSGSSVLRGLLVGVSISSVAVLSVGVAPERSAASSVTEPAKGLGSSPHRPSSLPSAPIVRNEGQLPSRVHFSGAGGGLRAFFLSSRIRFAGEVDGREVAVDLSFPGSRRVRPRIAGRSGTRVSFLGTPTGSVATADRLVYRGLWPGIDLRFRADASGFKSAFVIRPGADEDLARVSWRGATRLREGPGGSMLVVANGLRLVEEPPVAFQPGPGPRRIVPSSYDLRAGPTYGFDVGAHDPTRRLVIDPELHYASFLGGSGDDVVWGVRAHPTGDLVVGSTNALSSEFPLAPGVSDRDTQEDAFIAKVNPEGTALVFLSFLSGSSWDSARGAAVDASGAIYVAGVTSSDQASFPVVQAYDGTFGGFEDAFLAKLNPAGTQLLFSTYLGGNLHDSAVDVEIDSTGAPVVAGTTSSYNNTFPTKVGPDTEKGEYTDAFVARFRADGSAITYSGFIGGNSPDEATGLALDGTNSAYVVGTTTSRPDSFPVTVGPSLTRYSQEEDAFVAKIAPGGASFVYAGYIGSAGFDRGLGIDVDSTGSAYVAGSYGGGDSPFLPMPGNGAEEIGYGSVMIAKVTPSGSGLAYARYIGGESHEWAEGVGVDEEGRAYLTGHTFSTNFPTVGDGDHSFNGKGAYYGDAFVLAVAPTGSGLEWSTYLGGMVDDAGWDLDVGGGHLVVGGSTFSADFPTTGIDRTNSQTGHYFGDGFVAAYRLGQAAPGSGGAPTSGGAPASGAGPAVSCKDVVATVVGTDGPDALVGTAGPDVIVALAGRDRIAAYGAGDIVCAGRGKDLVSGGSGDDLVLGEQGNDVLRGAGGGDVVSGGPGRDVCQGGGGSDRPRACESLKAIP